MSSEILSFLAYAPIALFAENLRLQYAMVSSILTPCSIAPVTTGCVKDLHRLWEMDPVQLFGNFEDERTTHVTSVKHGNSFPLQNRTLLTLANVLKRKPQPEIVPYLQTLKEPQIRRETVLSLSFVLPYQDMSSRSSSGWLQAACWSVTLVEVLGPIVITVWMVLNNIITGAVLMLAISTSVLILAVLRALTRPIIANQSDMAKCRTISEYGKSKLDVHVIADSWNDKHLNVVCGYTSHLHALTNIPVAISHPSLLLWSSRALAAVLLIQAASLASLTGQRQNAWVSLTWLAIYIVMLFPAWVLRTWFPETTYMAHTAEVITVPPIQFSCRRAALVFISRLPVSITQQVDPWAWANVFVPDNERRRCWTSQVEETNFLTAESTSWERMEKLSELDEAERLKTKDLVQEASAAYHHPKVLQPLLAYKTAVGL